MNSKIHETLKLVVFSLVIIAICLPAHLRAETPPTVEYLGIISNMAKPIGMALVSETGDLYVASNANSTIFRFDSTGRLITSRKFPEMVNGVAITGEGRILVTQRDRLAVCDKELNAVGEIGAGEFL
ncbi:MAG: hypothetical protein HYS23_13850, partial [Geobacter sp.]|nr:hypothetical protein [Geobacter sp.]